MPSALHFLIPGPLETPTGGYVYGRRIVDGLRRRGIDVNVGTLAESFPFPDDEALRTADAVLGAMADRSLVVVDGLAFGAMPDIAAKHSTRLRLVALVHHPLALETGLDESQKSHFMTSERRALAQARGAVVTSAYTADLIAERFGVPRAAIAVVEPGTDPAPAAAGSGGPGVGLLCVGSLTPRKGHADLIAALARHAALDWRLDCVGSLTRDKATVARVQALAAAHGLGERISFLGDRPAAALATFYDRADLFVLASRFEGYGMVLAEALARGLPIVATKAGAVARWLPKAAARLVPPGDIDALSEALGELIDDKARRRRLAIAARRAGRDLPTWEMATDRFADAINAIGAVERV